MSERKQALRDEVIVAREELMAAIRSLSDEDWDRPTVNPAWSARDILTHLSISEAGNIVRMKRVLAGTGQLPADWDLNRYNNRAVEKRRGADVGDLIAALVQSRQELLVFLDNLSDDQLDVRGSHGSGRELTIAEMFGMVANHERNHARDIRSAKAR